MTDDLLERLAARGAPAGADVMIERVEAELAGGMPEAAPRRGRPWLAGAVAAVLVLVVVGGGVWLLARPGEGPASPTALPSGDVAWPEFEMFFVWGPPGQELPVGIGEVPDQNRVSRLLWAGGDAWRIDEFEVDGGDLRLVESVVVHEGYRHVVGDRPEPPMLLEEGGMAPNAWLAEVAPSLAWTRARPVPDSDPVPVTPAHPLAAVAAESDRMRMEFTADGIPVLWQMDENELAWHVLTIDRRPVSSTEIGAGLEEAGASRSPAAGEVVRTVEGDGFAAELVVSSQCLEVVIRSAGTLLMTGGGCEPLPSPPDESILGSAGVALPDGRWLAVYMGGPAISFTRIEVTHPDGSVHVDDLVDGYWLLAVPTDESPAGAQVRALDAAGREVSAGEIAVAEPGG